MKFFPCDNFVIETKKPAVKVLDDLADNTEEFGTGYTGFFDKDKQTKTPFIGAVFDDGFELRRRIFYRNSFLPVIKGTVTDEENKTIVSVKMHLSLFTSVFMVIWFIAVIVMFVTLILKEGFLFTTNELIFPGIMIFSYALMTAGYNIEASKAKSLLKNIIE